MSDAVGPHEGVEADEAELLSRAAHSAELSAEVRAKISLTDEELLLPPDQRAALLQQKARAVRLAKEKQDAYDAERNRIASQKALLDSQQKLKEQEAARALEQWEREKREKKEAEDRQRELLRLEYKERFGVEREDDELAPSRVAHKSTRERVKLWAGKLQVRCAQAKSATDGTLTVDQMRLCVKTLLAYANNVIKEPENCKYKTISRDNKAFKERVQPVAEAVELLQVMGFRAQSEQDAFTMASPPDTVVLHQAVQFLEHIMRTI